MTLNKKIEEILYDTIGVEYGVIVDRDTAAGEILTLVQQESKNAALEFSKFRDTYKRYESQEVHIEQKKLGGIFSWIGTTDERIYELYLKGEQKENPLLKEYGLKDKE